MYLEHFVIFKTKLLKTPKLICVFVPALPTL